MAYDPIAPVEHAFAEVKRKGYLTRSDVVAIMADTRCLLEARGLQKTYPAIWFYCNWSAHCEIDQHELAHDFLTAIPGTLLGKGDVDYCAEVSKLLQVAGFRAQLKTLFTAEGLCLDYFVNFEKWQQFMGLLLERLRDRPLQFPGTGKGKQRYEDMMKKWGTEPMFVPEKIAVSCPTEGRKQITITTQGQITIVVDMVNTETKGAFLS